jgi:hypothetical protein
MGDYARLDDRVGERAPARALGDLKRLLRSLRFSPRGGPAGSVKAAE